MRYRKPVRVEVLMQLLALLTYDNVDRCLEAVNWVGRIVLEPELAPVCDEGEDCLKEDEVIVLNSLHKREHNLRQIVHLSEEWAPVC